VAQGAKEVFEMAYQKQDSQALTVPSAAQTALDEAQIDPRLIMAAKAIQLMAGQDDNGKPKISADMALAAAMYQAGTGQLLGRDFYVNEKIGRMEGYRGVSRDAMDRGVGEVQIKYRSLTTQEAEDHEIAAGDTAVVCEVYQLRAWNMAQRMGQPYEPISGVGVVRKVEKYDKKSTQRWDDSAKRYVPLPESGWRFLNLEGGMTWRKKAQNRAYKEALRHVPGAHASAAEVLEEATIHGMTEQPPEAARLSMEQAIAWAKQHEVAGGPDWDAIEEGEFTEVKPEAPSAQDAANDAAFEQLPSASAERAAGNGKARPEWGDKEAAVEWGFAQGCFDHANHTENAFNKVVTAVKAEHAPKIPTYAQVFDAWHTDVMRRVEDHNAKISAALDAQAAGDEMPVFESR
jgi:hypothetical protein